MIPIGDDIHVMVVEVRGDRVRLGVSAPPDVTVHRKEVYEAIEAATNPDKEIVGSTSVVSARPAVVSKIRKEVVSMT
jgi:carbon storage regulator